MKPTPHLLIAAGLLLTALIAVLGTLFGGSASFPIPTTELRITAAQADLSVLPAEAATKPLRAELADELNGNPFTLAAATERGAPHIPPPPPPPLTLPAPPALPLIER